MGKIVVFGAGGRVGRAAVGEALRRGHQVTAVVRAPDRHQRLTGATVRAGDVTDADAIADLATGHDAAIMAAYDAGARPDVFFPAAARALVDGLTRAGVGRLVTVGLAATLKTPDGTPLMDTPGFPQEFRPICLGHAAASALLRSSDARTDWLIVSPAGDFDHAGARSGRYTIAEIDMAGRVSYADLAVALLDEIDTPRHHRTHIGVTAAGGVGDADDTRG
ncbi:NAD-dependent epimerase/dehydratase family protein [Nonomuraea sp. KC401]|uniref:NAD(P)-dependent oxidoreductase n=1 Tax=unclassified Nonomuraea TaxID=2593643 RepID=UPI0010FD896D|nr:MULTISPECIES: NAD(P)H-binding protein [unclassified Nonomuraea]NBE92000.1 NAD(P)H-binding protein [Nonomuraea sp. K271]TLF74203.1 NAD-dependent epimerase/dehydratase family protein [Nonomuraea sp. KC401]